MDGLHNTKRYRPQGRHRVKLDVDDGYTPARSSTDYCESFCDVNSKESRGVDFAAGAAVAEPPPQLPNHVEDLILGRMPARQRCQMRHVCKAWTTVQDSTRVDHQEEVWFVMARPPSTTTSSRPPEYGDANWRFKACSSFSLDISKGQGSEAGEKPFFQPPLPNPHHSKLSSLLGTGRDCSRVYHKLKCQSLKNHISVDNLFLRSAGGLMSAVVCRPGAENCYDFIVFNCLTGCVKVLPPHVTPVVLTRFLSMTLDGQDPSCYYILAEQGDSQYFEFFDSRRDCWKVVSNPYVPFKSFLSMSDFVVTHSSSEQLSVVDADFWWFEWEQESLETGLLGYHARHDTWSSLLVPIPNEDENAGRTLLLAKYKSGLFLGQTLVDADDTILGFVVWELRPTSLTTGTWVEVARTPDHLRPTLKSIDWKIELTADGGLFWMTFCLEKNHRAFRPPLVFDMAANSWHSLPLTRTSRNFGCIFVHRPRFSAIV